MGPRHQLPGIRSELKREFRKSRNKNPDNDPDVGWKQVVGGGGARGKARGEEMQSASGTSSPRSFQFPMAQLTTTRVPEPEPPGEVPDLAPRNQLGSGSGSPEPPPGFPFWFTGTMSPESPGELLPSQSQCRGNLRQGPDAGATEPVPTSQ